MNNNENNENKGLVVAELLNKQTRKNKRDETYYLLEVSIKRTITDKILELINEEKSVSVSNKNPFYVFTNIGRNKYAYTLEKGCIYAFWFIKTHSEENNEDYYHITNWRKLSHDERSVQRTLNLVINKSELEEEGDETITNRELLTDLQNRMKSGRISLQISAVNSDDKLPLEIDTDLKDNESNFRINLQESGN